ncbi:MAG: type 3 dihydrofolate reductase [Saprospiraceae bacterium]|nr:type 3 dihydrofolate reductase [Saprospiraceae bacterium]
MKISAIVAASKNNVIGIDNQIPWYLPADLKYFKATTLNHHVIMGRKSYDSIGRPLPKRTNMVITRDLFFTATGVQVVHSIEEALHLAVDQGEQEAFIIGGGEIYKQSMPYWDRVYLTRVDIELEGHAYFPELDPADWNCISSEPHEADEKNEVAYTFEIYDRIVN